MHCKTCTDCGKDSYSAAVNSKWICPYCNIDLTNEPAKPATAKDEVHNEIQKHLVHMKSSNTLALGQQIGPNRKGV